jgi:acetyl esterase/lipase/lysophospholipase L1-like esterase
MKKIVLSIFVCAQALIFNSQSWAQTRVIPLEQSLPASLVKSNLKEGIIDSIPDKRFIYNVFKPSLLYFPAKGNTSGTSVIIAPGGALQVLSIDNEGFEVAKFLNGHGIDAFVLKYSLVPTYHNPPYKEMMKNFFSGEARRDSMISTIIPYSMKDGLSAISYVREHSGEFNLNPDRIGFMGFSAGGTVAMSVVYNCTDSNRPNFIGAIYPWIGEIKGEVPKSKTPAFIAIANDDQLKLVPHSLEIFEKWTAANQPVELHVYGIGGHGFGADKNYNPADNWIEAFVNWLGGEGFLWPTNPKGFLAGITYKDLIKMRSQQEELMKTDWGNLSKYRENNKDLSSKNIKDKIVFYGNSITENWIRLDQDFFEKNQFIDRGISGQTTPQMLVRFRDDVINLNPSVVVILAGTNDIAGNTGPATLENIFGNIVSMAELAKANKIKVILSSVLPVYNYPWSPGLEPSGKIVKLNVMLQSYAKKNNIVYVDYHTPMADERNGLKAEYSEDGVHPNLKGYKVMDALVEKAIKETLDK